MPLPAPGQPWPPIDHFYYYGRQESWQQWWAGDPWGLKNAALQRGEDGQRRRFWQRRAQDDKQRATHALHAPLAADIAVVSADLLYGEPPALDFTGEGQGGKGAADKAQKRFDEIREDNGLDNLLLEGAEMCAALGSCYLRPIWDTDVSDDPILTVMPGNRAVPDFAYGRMVAVTFWEDILYEDPDTRSAVVWRHLERHERGKIYHGLYQGDWAMLGSRVPLGKLAETAGYEDEITLPEKVLLPSYIPNALPNRRFPYEKRPLGRSDFDGSESFLDALDETWTSWLRDLRAGQARVLADTSLLTPQGTPGTPGRAREFDLDQELFTLVNMTEADKPLSEIQFNIRVAEHADTASKLTYTIVSAAGYSPQTFGMDIEGLAQSGTALRMRENKTYRTQGRKQRYNKPPVEHSGEMLLWIDRNIFKRSTPVLRPCLTWPELIDDPAGRATWINLLKQANAASIRTRVQLAQPELTGDELDAEVAAIMDEQSMSVPDPAVPMPDDADPVPPRPEPTDAEPGSGDGGDGQ